MRTNNIFGFAFATPQRERVVRTLLEYPGRQWSVPTLEQMTGLPHATVYRTVNGLWAMNLLKSLRINRRDMVFTLAEGNLLAKALGKASAAAASEAKEIAQRFTDKIALLGISTVILYGSGVRQALRPESDIDVLVIVEQVTVELRQRIHDIAAELSILFNRPVAALIMSHREVQRERNGQFLVSVRENMEVLYGKTPF